MPDTRTYSCPCGCTFNSDRPGPPPGWTEIYGNPRCPDCSVSFASPLGLGNEDDQRSDAGSATSRIFLRSGAYFDLADPDFAIIRSIDIAAGLRQFRFSGQSPKPYTIAQHSLLVLALVEPEARRCGTMEQAFAHDLRRCALLHDAAEAFIHDVTRPLKDMLPDYRRIERRIEKGIAAAFGVRWSDELRKIVKHADLAALAIEKRLLFDRDECFRRPLVVERVWGPEEAEARFLEAFDALSRTTTGQVAA